MLNLPTRDLLIDVVTWWSSPQDMFPGAATNYLCSFAVTKSVQKRKCIMIEADITIAEDTQQLEQMSYLNTSVVKNQTSRPQQGLEVWCILYTRVIQLAALGQNRPIYP